MLLVTMLFTTLMVSATEINNDQGEILSMIYIQKDIIVEKIYNRHGIVPNKIEIKYIDKSVDSKTKELSYNYRIEMTKNMTLGKPLQAIFLLEHVTLENIKYQLNYLESVMWTEAANWASTFFIETKGASKKMVEVKGASANGNAKSFWEYTMEEIEALTDAKTIESVYANMRSKKSKYPTVVAAIADYEDRLAAISTKRNALIAAEKSGLNKVDKALLDKLGTGSKAVLTAQQAADLFAILAKLQRN